MSTTTVLILLAISNPACGFIGYLIGRIARDTAETKDAVTHDVEQTDGLSEDKSVGPRWRMNVVVVIGMAVAAIGVVTALIGFSVTRNQDQLAGCVVGYSNATADALEARSSAATEANQQVENVFRAFLAAFSDTPAVGRERVQHAFEEYLKAREATAKAQKDNPLPEAPRDACADLLD